MNKQLASTIIILLLFQSTIVLAKTGESEASQTMTESKPLPVMEKSTHIKSTDIKSTDINKTITPEKAFEPIKGAFGIPLGKKFDHAMVTKVLGEEPEPYKGADGKKLKGSVYQVEPQKPDERFQNYSVKTTDEGIIYAIQGNYQFEVEKAKGKQAGKVKMQRTVRKTCKNAVKALAKELEAKHGKPRGEGYDGEWFSFRQTSDISDKNLKLYAHRCRTGLYSIIYSDRHAQKKTLPQPQPKTTEPDEG